jgi:hypothetical protein
MATTTLTATLNTPMCELRPVPMERILVIEDDAAFAEDSAAAFLVGRI